MHQINLERPNGEPAMLDTSVSDPINQTRTQWTDLFKTATGCISPNHIPRRLAGRLAGGGVGSGEGPLREAPGLQMRANQTKVEREQLGGKTLAGVYAEGIA